jgi:hypothetical protein
MQSGCRAGDVRSPSVQVRGDRDEGTAPRTVAARTRSRCQGTTRLALAPTVQLRASAGSK